jgi:hypothetical protein
MPSIKPFGRDANKVAVAASLDPLLPNAPGWEAGFLKTEATAPLPKKCRAQPLFPLVLEAYGREHQQRSRPTRHKQHIIGVRHARPR